MFKFYILLPFLNGDIALFKRAKYLPPFDEKYLTGDKNKQFVLLFNPSPLEITYTAKANRRQIGSNGSDFDGWIIYNGKAFIRELSGDTLNAGA